MKIFVFGSNLAGRHGKGAALTAATMHGAIYGKGQGLMGNSYAIPTKNKQMQPIPLRGIAEYIEEFLAFANKHPQMTFLVTKIGCGQAAYRVKDIAPLFHRSPKNVRLPEEFLEYLNPGKVDPNKISFDKYDEEPTNEANRRHPRITEKPKRVRRKPVTKS